MTIRNRGTVNYTPNAQDLFKIYLEICEIIVCFAVAIVKELFTLTVRAVRFCQKWQEWRWFGRLGPVEIGFDLRQQWDDLEAVWFTWDHKEVGFSIYYCRQNGWQKVSWH
jgi:hypothetical protein